MSNRKNKSELPFNSTSSNDFNKLYNKNTENTITYKCNNNDFFTDIYPDLNYINHTNKNPHTIQYMNLIKITLINVNIIYIFFIQILEAVHITKLMISNVIYRP